MIWGTQLIGGGRIMPGVNAWSTDVTWGAARTSTGDTVEWGIRKFSGKPWRV